MFFNLCFHFALTHCLCSVSPSEHHVPSMAGPQPETVAASCYGLSDSTQVKNVICHSDCHPRGESQAIQYMFGKTAHGPPDLTPLQEVPRAWVGGTFQQYGEVIVRGPHIRLCFSGLLLLTAERRLDFPESCFQNGTALKTKRLRSIRQHGCHKENQLLTEAEYRHDKIALLRAARILKQRQHRASCSIHYSHSHLGNHIQMQSLVP